MDAQARRWYLGEDRARAEALVRADAMHNGERFRVALGEIGVRCLSVL